MIHHGNEQVEQHHNIDNRVGAKHQHAPESGEDLNAIQLKAVQIYQAKDSPEKGLSCLK